MKYNIFKYILVGFLFIVPLSFTSICLANSPDIKGRVVDKFNNSKGIAGVWVKWEDGNGSIRFAQTDADGKFVYPGWQTANRQTECNRQIDTNLDLIKDNVQARTNYSGDSCNVHAFGCVESPHKWSVVLPTGWKGNFKNVSSGDGINLPGYNNGQGALDIGVLYWEPSCECLGINIDDMDNLAPDKTVTLTTKAKIPNPSRNSNKVNDMIYTIERNDIKVTPIPGENWKVIATGPEYTNIAGIPMGVYSTNLSFHIPSLGQGIETYKVNVELNCGSAMSFWKTFDPKIVSAATFYGGKSLKLGTFYPPQLGKGCDQLWFKINYDDYNSQQP